MRNNGLPNVRERTVSQLVAGASLREPSRFSKLENGLKVVTCDNGGDLADIGLYVKAGSRWEKLSERGATKDTNE